MTYHSITAMLLLQYPNQGMINVFLFIIYSAVACFAIMGLHEVWKRLRQYSLVKSGSPRPTPPKKSPAPPPEPVEREARAEPLRERELIRERVLIMCPFCSAKVEQGISSCPHCGGRL
jgi:hypothetical protein